jgi:hypothetical protein
MKERVMSDGDEFSALDDPEFLAERARVRAALEYVPEHEANPELLARFQRLDEEFIRRARAAWAPANWKAEEGG